MVHTHKTGGHSIPSLREGQHQAGALSLAGHPMVQVPSPDRLIRPGTRFTNALCTSPIGFSARASVLAGYIPRETGQQSNAPALRSDPRTFAATLRKLACRADAMEKTQFLPYGLDLAAKDLYPAFEDRIPTQGEMPGVRSWMATTPSGERKPSDAAAKRADFLASESAAGYSGEPSPLPDERLPKRWVIGQAIAWLRQRAHDRTSFYPIVSLDRPPPLNLMPEGVAEPYSSGGLLLRSGRDPSDIADRALRRRIRTMGWQSLRAVHIRKILAGHHAGWAHGGGVWLSCRTRWRSGFGDAHCGFLPFRLRTDAGPHGTFSTYCFHKPPY